MSASCRGISLNKRQYPLINDQELDALYNALHFMKMAELKKGFYILSLPELGKKGELIERIITFIKTGQVKELQKIPSQSLAKNYPSQSLHATSLMLYGSYKNDLQTRKFFKELIGPHFHFTAFGIDWLNEHWLQGNPPTYQEFARYWIGETKRREKIKAEPKKEWAYISFLQRMIVERPQASREQLMQGWKKLQADKARSVFKILEEVAKKISSNTAFKNN
jgi:hypothetical protein